MCVKHSAKRLVHNGVEKKCSYYFSNSIIYMCVCVCVYKQPRYIQASLVAQ